VFYVDRAIGRLALISAVIEYLNTRVQHDRPLLQSLRLIIVAVAFIVMSLCTLWGPVSLSFAVKVDWLTLGAMLNSSVSCATEKLTVVALWWQLRWISMTFQLGENTAPSTAV